jgi:hypothetical protein
MPRSAKFNYKANAHTILSSLSCFRNLQEKELSASDAESVILHDTLRIVWLLKAKQNIGGEPMKSCGGNSLRA